MAFAVVGLGVALVGALISLLMCIARSAKQRKRFAAIVDVDAEVARLRSLATQEVTQLKAAAVDEEAQETKAATQAEQKAIEEKAEAAAAEAGSTSATSNANTGAAPEPTSKVKSTVMPVDNKTKANQKTTVPAKPAANQPNDGRPRKTKPDQQ